jgi:hypothetical protein
METGEPLALVNYVGFDPGRQELMTAFPSLTGRSTQRQ